ncbi:hypothetical protein PFISCL1PPCAC_15297 [Pristionchus fissidentatus]|uniref:Nuclear receptor n=1 Tax=Pristionchus fissidentatus TaxID=1538716 RepID=A0AAV5W116_9BILA|nr:hypothetical protein PFISCL1PPCAC_15297 [Pristionchus fissidentatus]
MPSKLHTCLVCSSQTKHAHMGILLCRACKIFYGRAQNRKKPLVCRAGTNDCSHKCKQCRFMHITRLLRGNPNKSDEKMMASPEVPNEPTASTSKADRVEVQVSDPFPTDPNGPKFGRLVCSPSFDGCNSFLSRIRICYSMMSFSRRSTELAALHPKLHPILTFNGSFPLIPATTATSNITSRSLFQSLFDFCTSAFDEFANLTLQQKWFIVKSFRHPFYALESAYRIYRDHPDSPPMVFMSLMTYLDKETTRGFAVESSESIRENSQRCLGIYIDGDVHRCRDSIARLKPTEEEFLALLVLLCWNIEDCETESELISIGATIRQRILSELEEIYKKNGRKNGRKGEWEYATRLGEILTISSFFQLTSDALPFKMEMLRLHNIIDEDTFLYAVTRS